VYEVTVSSLLGFKMGLAGMGWAASAITCFFSRQVFFKYFTL
jgi:hypothetical protein